MDQYLNIKGQAYEQFTAVRKERWNQIASSKREWNGSRYYHKRLHTVYQHMIPAGSSVLEIGSGMGNLLAALQPSVGVGVDFSEEMVASSQQKYPHLTFIHANAQNLPDLGQTFDFILLSDLVNDVWDVQGVFNELRPFCKAGTRILMNYYSNLWELPLRVAQKLNVAKPMEYQNWLTNEDIRNLLVLCGFEDIHAWREILLPIGIPLISSFFNRFLARIWPFNHLCMTNVMTARLASCEEEQKPASVSVVIAARNEAGNIAQIFERVPEMGSHTEIVFVEGHSTDNTYEVIQEHCTKTDRDVKAFQQTGKGKGDAIRLGFEKATGDILMILDADLTVPPEDLPRFYEALVSNKGDFINGVRLVYPMEKQAMRFFNLIGNKFFSLAFSWLLGQSIKDTLCGTKVLWREEYQKIAHNRAYFGDFDPFGDFDLIFGAAKLNHKIIDLPIRYRERTYGTTNIQRWRHGVLLLRMLWVAAVRLKFI